MKQLNLSVVISSFLLGLSIVISSLIISNSGDRELNKDKINEKEYKPLMTIQETAEYLKITESQVKTIISSEDTMLRTSGLSGKLFPVIRIGTDNYISTEDLKDWLKDSTALRKQY
ncbi:helix-turn-helix domain-containing protein [Paenibacillus puldeungensis]|uniref:Helix-turn-helix domain-containing protein n=1 Tax=Paenibacillus puldeungensis TaxID=696536 RepID=A0ABW3RV54_9BACL